MLRYRLISTCVLIPITVLLLFFLPPVILFFITVFICMLAAWEWGILNGFTSNFDRINLALFFGFLLSLILLTLLNYQFNKLFMVLLLFPSVIWWFFALLLILFYPNSAILWVHSKSLRLMFGVLIIVPFFLSIVMLRIWNYNQNHYVGALWLLYVMTLVWGADSGAYVFGRTLGKHKFAPKISLKKTWQGFIGGLFTSILISYVYSILANLKISLLMLLFTELASVLGDLAESMFKREIGIKDSSCLIPGHGGILDRIDSMTAAIPVFTLFLLLGY